MLRNGTGFVLFLLIVAMVIWGLYALRLWWLAEPRDPTLYEVDDEIPVTDAVALLERAGYAVMTVKRRIPLYITVDGGEEQGGQDLEGRILVDHFARKEDKLYIVKIEKDHKPMDWTAGGLRDQLLLYALLYREAGGIVVVQPGAKQLHTVQFEIGE